MLLKDGQRLLRERSGFRIELGFEPRNVLAVGLASQDMRKYRVAAKAQFESELVTRVRELPGVVAAGIW